MKKKGIIDLGTNTFHLLIVEKQGNELITLHYEYEGVRLGEGGIHKNELTKESMNRGIETLLKFKKTLIDFNVTDIEAIGTSALRNAKNAQDFVNKVFEKTGISITIISGEKEAELIYQGVTFGVTLQKEHNYLIMDIGGGSIEFIICNTSGILWKQSFEIGGQRLIRSFHQHDPILNSEISALTNYLTDNLKSLKDAILKYLPKKLIGASGAFDTLYDIHIKQNNFSKSEHNPCYELTLNECFKMTEEIIKKSEKERNNIVGMIPLRVRMIVVASILIEYVLKEYKIESLICTDYALKEGVSYNFLVEN